jgi:hypothetical protein
MRAVALLGLVLAGCDACQPHAPASPADVAWGALVDAGCSASDPAGPLYVAEQLDAGAPAWLVCLSQGNGVRACSVPLCPGDAGQ